MQATPTYHHPIFSAELPTKRQAAGLPLPTSHHAAPRFSGLGQNVMMAPVIGPAAQWLEKRSMTFFQNVMELYLWGFFAQDVIALWVPRIWTSLERGAIPYDIDKDPTSRHLTGWKRSWKSFVSKTKGLNWPNFSEETKREIATGPGLIVIPTLAYTIMRRLAGRSAVELSHPSLTKYYETLKPHINAIPSSSEPVSEQAYKDALKSYMKGLFDYDALSKGQALNDGKSITLLEDNKWLQQALKDRNFSTLEDAITAHKNKLDDWAERWVDTAWREHLNPTDKRNALQKLADDVAFYGKKAFFWVTNREKHEKLKPRSAGPLEQLEAEFIDYVKKFNDDFLKFELSNIIDYAPIKTKVKNAAKVVMDSAGHFLGEMRRVNEFAFNVLNIRNKGSIETIPHVLRKPYQWLKLDKPIEGSLSDIAETLYKKLVGRKVLVYTFLSIATGAYLYRLTRWTQSHEKYVANRLVEFEDKAKDKQAQSAKKAAGLGLQVVQPQAQLQTTMFPTTASQPIAPRAGMPVQPSYNPFQAPGAPPLQEFFVAYNTPFPAIYPSAPYAKAPITGGQA